MLNKKLRRWFRRLIEVGLSLVTIGIVLQILFGEKVAFLPGDIVGNIVAKVVLLGDYELVGVVVGASIFWLFVYAGVWRDESKASEDTAAQSPSSSASDKTR
ncbi:MAG: hypothetical protein QF666_00630 [Alphaproteobacteria bacterium]|nr:hypothetical protein [Alphaproteobacteria bacterium]